MKNIFLGFTLAFLAIAFSACKVGSEAAHTGQKSQALTETVRLVRQTEIDMASIRRSLDELAELERAGTWLTGMALTESGIRENAGDFTGAVAAAYKELSLAYGRGLIQKADVEQGLSNLLEIKSEAEVISAANAVLAFSREQWTQADSALSLLFGKQDEQEEPDSFASWMILVCTLEKAKVEKLDDRRAGAAYKAIRARYAQFPEYWYRGARAFSGAIAADYAESCINSAMQGPFAEECRKILAEYTGLKTEDGSSIRTKKEIESIISQSINAANPQLLEPLFPLIGLPDNPYTIYAVGALRALTGVPTYKEFFITKAGASRGRLAERLTYICNG